MYILNWFCIHCGSEVTVQTPGQNLGGSAHTRQEDGPLGPPQ